MNVIKDIEKAMIDKGIRTAIELSEASGVSYYKVLRLLKGDLTVRLKDLVTIADCLDVKLILIFN